MLTKLQNPFAAAALGLALSVGLGVTLCWQAALPLIALARAKQTKQIAEKKAKGWDFWTVEIENLSNELKEERASLRQQSDSLSQRAARLDAEEKELAKVRTDLEALRAEITGRMVEISADEAKNLRTLAQTYTKLTPKAAVAILREMDDTTVVKILALMKPEAVGSLFEEMSRTAAADGSLARRAAALTEKLRLIKSAKPGSPA